MTAAQTQVKLMTDGELVSALHRTRQPYIESRNPYADKVAEPLKIIHIMQF